jgi:two-component sensor histidine kinase
MRELRARPGWPLHIQISIGAAAAVVAVAVRYSLPLTPQQLPTITVVIALAVVTTFVGIWAGVTTALVGGLASWYFFFNANSWSLANDAWVPLIGFVVIATVIINTAYLYRSSERMRHEGEMAKLRAEADTANLFAREMGHRLKNALTIVQSIAFQTIGPAVPESAKFAGRLKALAAANELLSEHVRQPTAAITDVIDAALEPFRDSQSRFHIDAVSAPIPAQQVVSVALVIHELATNATKYGSLSNGEGTVSLEVKDAGDHLRLTWKERDGPQVLQPANQGFGTRLLRRSGIDTRLEFEPDGLCCTIGIRKA